MELQQRGHVSEIRVRSTCLVQQDKVKTCISKGFEREDATLPTGVIVPLSFVKITHGAPGEKGSHEQSECSPTTVDHDTWTKLRYQFVTTSLVIFSKEMIHFGGQSF